MMEEQPGVCSSITKRGSPDPTPPISFIKEDLFFFNRVKRLCDFELKLKAGFTSEGQTSCCTFGTTSKKKAEKETYCTAYKKVFSCYTIY